MADVEKINKLIIDVGKNLTKLTKRLRDVAANYAKTVRGSEEYLKLANEATMLQRQIRRRLAWQNRLEEENQRIRQDRLNQERLKYNNEQRELKENKKQNKKSNEAAKDIKEAAKDSKKVTEVIKIFIDALTDLVPDLKKYKGALVKAAKGIDSVDVFIDKIKDKKYVQNANVSHIKPENTTEDLTQVLHRIWNTDRFTQQTNGSDNQQTNNNGGKGGNTPSDSDKGGSDISIEDQEIKSLREKLKQSYRNQIFNLDQMSMTMGSIQIALDELNNKVIDTRNSTVAVSRELGRIANTLYNARAGMVSVRKTIKDSKLLDNISKLSSSMLGASNKVAKVADSFEKDLGNAGSKAKASVRGARSGSSFRVQENKNQKRTEQKGFIALLIPALAKLLKKTPIWDAIKLLLLKFGKNHPLLTAGALMAGPALLSSSLLWRMFKGGGKGTSNLIKNIKGTWDKAGGVGKLRIAAAKDEIRAGFGLRNKLKGLHGNALNSLTELNAKMAKNGREGVILTKFIKKGQLEQQQLLKQIRKLKNAKGATHAGIPLYVNGEIIYSRAYINVLKAKFNENLVKLTRWNKMLDARTDAFSKMRNMEKLAAKAASKYHKSMNKMNTHIRTLIQSYLKVKQANTSILGKLKNFFNVGAVSGMKWLLGRGGLTAAKTMHSVGSNILKDFFGGPFGFQGWKSAGVLGKTGKIFSGPLKAIAGTAKWVKTGGKMFGPLGVALAGLAEIPDIYKAAKSGKKGALSSQLMKSGGGIIGGLAGGAIGAALGSAFGPVGTILGGILGSIVGDFIGRTVGKFFAGVKDGFTDTGNWVKDWWKAIVNGFYEILPQWAKDLIDKRRTSDSSKSIKEANKETYGNVDIEDPKSREKRIKQLQRDLDKHYTKEKDIKKTKDKLLNKEFDRLKKEGEISVIGYSKKQWKEKYGEVVGNQLFNAEKEKREKALETLKSMQEGKVVGAIPGENGEPQSNHGYKVHTINKVDNVVDLEELGLYGKVQGAHQKWGNSLPYVPERYISDLKALDKKLYGWGVGAEYSSNMGGHAADSGHGQGRKVDVVTKKVLTPAQYKQLYNEGWFGHGSGALGYEHTKGQQTVTTPEEYERLYNAGKVTMGNNHHYDLKYLSAAGKSVGAIGTVVDTTSTSQQATTDDGVRDALLNFAAANKKDRENQRTRNLIFQATDVTGSLGCWGITQINNIGGPMRH